MNISQQAARAATAILLLLFIGFSESPSQCFSCSDAPPGTIWCDDFEDGIPLSQKYFEYDNNGGDCIVMALVGRDSSNGVRIVWQAGEVGAGGIICFVSNGAWLDGNGMDGFRKSLEKEFSSIYVFNLRGNQRTSGELSRKEGGKIFGSGSRTPIAITLLVKKGNEK